MAMTVEQAKSLPYHTRLHLEAPFGRPCDSKNGPHIWRVNGKVQVWVRDPERFRLPIKHGLYAYSDLDAGNLDRFHIERECHVMAMREAFAHGHPDWSHLMAYGPCTIFSIHTPTLGDYRDGRLVRV